MGDGGDAPCIHTIADAHQIVRCRSPQQEAFNDLLVAEASHAAATALVAAIKDAHAKGSKSLAASPTCCRSPCSGAPLHSWMTV